MSADTAGQATIARRVSVVAKGKRRVASVEEDGACELTGGRRCSEIRTERHGAGRRLPVETAAIGIHQVAVGHRLAHVVGHESIAVGSHLTGREFVVADTDGDGRLRNEADRLPAEFGRSGYGGVPCPPLAAEVELIVRLARESDDVRSGGAQQRVCSQCAVVPVVRLIGVGIGVGPAVLAVIVVPEEGVGHRLAAARSIGIAEGGRIDIVRCRLLTLIFAQPVFVAYLGIAAVGRTAAAVEVGQLTLVLRSDQFGSERQTDSLPSLGERNVAVGIALIPHPPVASEGVADRRIEVLAVHQEVVVDAAVSSGTCRGALYNVAGDVGLVLPVHVPVDVVVIERDIVRVGGIVVHDIARHALRGVGSRTVLRDIDEQVLRQVAVGDTRQSVVVEQRGVEQTGSASQLIAAGSTRRSVEHVAVAGEVDGRHARISFCQSVFRPGSQVGPGIEVGHTHRLALEVSRCTVNTVGGISAQQPSVILADSRRQRLVFMQIVIAVVEHLSEEQVVVGPDGGVDVGGDAIVRYRALSGVVGVGDGAVSIDEVLVVIARLHIAHIAIPGIGRCRVAARQVGLGGSLGSRKRAVGGGEEVLILCG